jgi:Protein of unknown function (DUF4013)
MLDIRHALTFMSEDPRASEKVGLGALISLAPILNLAAIGYQVEVARRVAHGEPKPMPEWNDLKHLWVQGAWLGLAFYLYSLPLLLIVFSGMATVFAGLVLSLQSESAQSGTSLPVPPALVVVIFVVLAGAALIYGLILGLLRPAILAEYVQRGTLRACFDFGALWRFARQNLGEYLQLWLVELVLGWIVTVPLILLIFIVAFIPLVGPLLVTLVAAGAGFFILQVSSHLVGQLLRARSQSLA